MITISAALREREMGEKGLDWDWGVGWGGGEGEGMEDSPLRVLSPVEFTISLGNFYLFLYFFFIPYLFIYFFIDMYRK